MARLDRFEILSRLRQDAEEDLTDAIDESLNEEDPWWPANQDDVQQVPDDWNPSS